MPGIWKNSFGRCVICVAATSHCHRCSFCISFVCWSVRLVRLAACLEHASIRYSRRIIFRMCSSMNVLAHMSQWHWMPSQVHIWNSPSAIFLWGYTFIFRLHNISLFSTMWLIGVCTSFNEIHSSIILAGDPKQLDAVTKSANSASIGFKTSFLEHLANSPRYKRHPERRTYDTRYITQLVKNYRSHLSILRFSNSMFYENSLQALAPPGIPPLFDHFMQYCTYMIKSYSNDCGIFDVISRNHQLVHWLWFVAIEELSHHLQIRSRKMSKSIQGIEVIRTTINIIGLSS